MYANRVVERHWGQTKVMALGAQEKFATTSRVVPEGDR
ncbi:unannotated protein [freshwater metagenome]|uniref:Unannotated protein n=1 Tax=freshwater metagenome TaxID=449393 RepID=A0A6J6RUZ2_9ZZZZ